jgi:glutamine synthetase
VQLEQYTKLITIESRTLVQMVNTQVLPACLRAQAELADTVGATQSAGVECADSEEALKDLVRRVAELRAATKSLEAATEAQKGDAAKKVRYLRDTVVPAMQRVRDAADGLERLVPADLWPIPTYADLLLLGR